nr:uncharacterized protein LOC129388158 [Dermacentor andersoni]XP_054934301.1 uncharacterized protein LOC129388160 [Dermacentor andersoni]
MVPIMEKVYEEPILWSNLELKASQQMEEPAEGDEEHEMLGQDCLQQGGSSSTDRSVLAAPTDIFPAVRSAHQTPSDTFETSTEEDQDRHVEEQIARQGCCCICSVPIEVQCV